MELNKEQKDAVEYTKGPVLIVAGAGTGKTRVITERIKFLLSKKLCLPKEILALTFTEKGAEEMLERVDTIMPIGYEEPWVTTFHSFADRILREEALEIGLDPRYKILTTSESFVLLRKNLFNLKLQYFLPLGNPTKFIDALLTFFSRLQDEGVDSQEFEEWVHKKDKEKKDCKTEELKRWEELSSVYKNHQQLKIKKSFMDFGDLILWTIKLFRERPYILEKYKKQFKYILVDEFQDTNFAQFQIIRLLAPENENPNLMVVGDDSQSIYKFRGAAISNILEFMEKYKKAKSIYLLKNYRTTQNILEYSYKLIQLNNPNTLESKLGINKNLISQKKDRGPARGTVPQIIIAQTGEEEAENVAEEIIKLIKREGYSYRDFAILARANNHLDNFIAALKRYQLPYQIIGNRGLFNQPEVSQLINFLRVCWDLSDNASLYSLLNSEMLNYEPSEILNALNIAKLKKEPLWEVVEKNKYFSFITEEIKKAARASKKQSVSTVLYNFIVNTKYPENLVLKESVENNLKINNLNLFFRYIKNYEVKEKDTSIVNFVEYLDIMMEAGENPAQAVLEDIDTINLLTAHSAKGLEFSVVFMVSLASDRFPTRNRHDPIEIPESLIKETLPVGDYHIQEERRLFYVGMTRAKDLLYLTYAESYGGQRQKKPSVFLNELGLQEKSKASTRETPFFQSSKYNANLKPTENAIPKFNPPFVSYSQINTFSVCPLQYKYKYVLKIPTKPSHTLTFGQSIHNTLREFHNYEVREHKVEEGEILKIYEKEFIPVGYENLEHRLQRFEQGKQALIRYIKIRKEKFGKPKYLEESFKLRNFEVPLLGTIDRIDQKNDQYEIIDYKTGTAKDQKAVDKDEQLTIYVMAAKEKLNIEPKKLSLYFIEGDIKMDTTRTKEDIEKEKGRIAKAITDIKNSSFEPKIGIQCKYCGFNKICPAYKNYLNF